MHTLYTLDLIGVRNDQQNLEIWTEFNSLEKKNHHWMAAAVACSLAGLNIVLSFVKRIQKNSN